MSFLYCRIYTTVNSRKTSLAALHNVDQVERKSRRLVLVIMTTFLLTSGLLCTLLIFDALTAGSGRGRCGAVVSEVVGYIHLARTVLGPLIYVGCNTMYAQCIMRAMTCQRFHPPQQHLPVHVRCHQQRRQQTVRCRTSLNIAEDEDTTSEPPHVDDGSSRSSSSGARSSVPTILLRHEHRRHVTRFSQYSIETIGLPTPTVDSGRCSLCSQFPISVCRFTDDHGDGRPAPCVWSSRSVGETIHFTVFKRNA